MRSSAPQGTMATMLLPRIESIEDYRQVYRNADAWLPAMREICLRHGLDPASLTLGPPGTHVVFRASGAYVKLFGSHFPKDFGVERRVLRALATQNLPVDVPRILGEGELEDWPYLILSPVAGTPLCEVRDALSDREMVRIAGRSGEILAALHALPTAGLEALDPGWPTFVDQQREAAIRSVAEAGLPLRWVKEIETLFERVGPLGPPDFQPVLAVADLTAEHLLLTGSGGKRDVTGLIDFGDTMLGHPLYDFTAPALEVTVGGPHRVRALFRAYGFAEPDLDRDLADRLTAWVLLHRFLNVKIIFDLLGLSPEADLARLRDALWPGWA